jgi:hypothetical protein
MLAEIAKGEVDLADVLFLIAVILFVIAAVMRFAARAWDSALVATGLAAAAFGWLLL